MKHLDMVAPHDHWRCYDYVFASVEYEYEGAPGDIIKRGDHRAVAIEMQGRNSHAIFFGGQKRDTMHSWRPTKSAPERLKRMGFMDTYDH